MTNDFLFAMISTKSKPTWRHSAWDGVDYVICTVIDLWCLFDCKLVYMENNYFLAERGTETTGVKFEVPKKFQSKVRLKFEFPKSSNAEFGKSSMFQKSSTARFD